MLRLTCGIVGLLFPLMCIARCVGQDAQALDSPKDEAQCSPQEVADRFLEVRARLDKPGELPRYLLGEPVIIHLEIRNLSEEHFFTFMSGAGSLPSYVVDATCQGKPVPYTLLGQVAVERFNSRGGLSGPQYDVYIPRFAETSRPIKARIMANIQCDMTQLGEYELNVRFRLRVHSLDEEVPLYSRFGEFGAGKLVVKEVRLDKPLRLWVNHRLYQLDSLPVEIPSSSEP
ncbi:hypothetical protein BH23PLA1_BH23PLA1_14540 [soil metagenome]